MKKITDFVSQDTTILFNEPMSKHTTFKIGGNADCMAIVGSTKELINVVNFSRESGIPFFILGNGSNLLVSDSGVEGIVIKLEKAFCEYYLDGQFLAGGSGLGITAFSQVALENSLEGLEWAFGIPGTVGGAVFMNAGAYVGSMSDVVLETEYLDENLKVCKLVKDEHEFGYRRSFFSDKPDDIIVSTRVLLNKGNKEDIWNKMKKCMEARIDKQPLNMPSAGSVFKRPKDAFVGKLIEDLGLKGFAIGGAQISEKHAGFIVNTGNAAAEDVKALIKYIKEAVFNKYGIELETEVKEVGRR